MEGPAGEREMTRRTSARVAGFTFLLYTAAGIGHEFLMHRATNADGVAAKLARIAAHAMDVRVTIVLTVLECLSALVLAVTLYGITREQDHELAMLGLTCRVAEGVTLAAAIPSLWQVLWLAQAGAAAAPDATTTNALRAFVLMPGPVPTAVIFYAVGSTIFSYLLLRGRIVPVALAWLGLLASALLAVTLPLQLAGFSTGPLTGYTQWAPALLFQLGLALWLLIKGVAAPRTAVTKPWPSSREG